MIDTTNVHDAVAAATEHLTTPDVSLLHSEAARRSRRRRQVAGVGGLLLLVVGILGAMRLLGRSNQTALDTAAVTTDAPSTANPEVESVDRAEDQLPPPETTPPATAPPDVDIDQIPVPSPARVGHTITWTGDEVIVFGGWEDEGRSQAFNDGYRFDPVNRAWSELAPAPIEERGGHVAFWTGDELLVLGGLSYESDGFTDGAAYEPSGERWRVLPSPSIGPLPETGEHLSAVWTGTEAILWYRFDDIVLAFDPATDTWRELPPTNLQQAVLSASLHWNGDRLIALSGESPGALEGAVLDGGSGSWQPLPPLPASVDFSDPFPANAGVVDGDLIAWSRSGGAGPTVRLARDAIEWEETTPIPLAPCEGHTTPISTGEALIVWELCGSNTIVTYTDTEGWQRVEVDNDVQVAAPTAVWTGSEVIALPTTCCFGAAGTEQWELAVYQLDPLATATSVIDPASPPVSALPTEPPDVFLREVTVPPTAGLALGPALDALDANGILAGELGGSANAPCPVVGTDPPAGAVVPAGTSVTIILSDCEN